MLDHIVSYIEDRTSKGESYKSALENSFQKLGWNGNLYNLNNKKLIGINKIVRKQYLNEVVNITTNLKKVFFLLIFLSFYTLIYLKTSLSFFKYSTLTFLLIPLIIGVCFHIKQSVIKRKSGYLLYSSFYVFFAFLILNMFFQFFKPDGFFSVSKETQKVIWFFATIVNSIFSIAGLSLHFKTIKKIKFIKNKIVD